MRPLHKLFLGLIALTSLAATAQHPISKALIRERVDENQVVPLRGNTPPAANAQNDAGRVSGSMAMTDLILVLRRNPEVQAAFDAFVESQYDANSPNFHHWLTPEQVGEQFGPAQADIATVSSWLSSHGLSVDEVSKDRMTIRFSGSARQVEAAFHTELHKLTVKGEAHFSNMSDPQIPMALEPVVLGPKALHNFRPKPLHRKNMPSALDGTAASKPASSPMGNAALTGTRPNIGFSCGTNCQIEDVTPFDFAAIYNIAPAWNSGLDGTGQTIAVVATSDVKQGDVSSFKQTFGLPAGLNLITKLAHGNDPGNCASTQPPSSANHWCTLNDQIENALDVEWSGATAPGAQIVLVVSGANSSSDDAVFDSAQYAVQNKTASILNVSYGLCELFLGSGGNTSYNNLWQSAAAAGIAVFVASGDAGAPACDQGGDANGTPYGAQYGLAVSGLASSPWVTAIGGTDLDWGATASPYWNNSNNSTTGASAKGYMPEIPWNNSCTNPLALSFLQGWANRVGASIPTDAETACNFAATSYQAVLQASGGQLDISAFVDSVGAGGGASNCTANSTTGTTIGTCSSSGYSKQSWQAGVTGIPADGKRDIPDVSFFSGNGLLGSSYFMCASDWGPCLSSPTATSEPTDSSNNTVNLIGGTSAASPAMAGIMALINQKAGSPQGNPNQRLYELAAAQSYGSCASENVTNNSSCYFNDIDTGTISMPCQKGSPNCFVTHSADTWGVLSGHSASVGYDLATGLGSMNVANVVNGWNATVGTTSSTVTVTPTPGSIQSHQPVSITVTVAGASGTPTGTVSLSGGGYSPSAQTLTSGSATFNVLGNTFSPGTVVLSATYNGDPTYASNTGTGSLTVTPAPLPTITVTPTSTAINSGQGLSVPVTVAGAGGTPTGNVTISGGGYSSSAQALSSGAVTFNIPANSLSAGAITLTASYSGDSAYGVATGTANVTVTQSTFTLASTSPAAISRGSKAISTITWTTSNNYSANISLTSCTLNSGGPANSSADTPRCTVTTSASGSTIGTATVSTSAATTGALQKPQVGGWAEAGGGALLALIVFLGIPARRKGWRTMVGMLVILFSLGALSACGGGGSSSGGGGSKDPGTASGTYTFTINATGTDPAATKATTTFSLTVN